MFIIRQVILQGSLVVNTLSLSKCIRTTVYVTVSGLWWVWAHCRHWSWESIYLPKVIQQVNQAPGLQSSRGWLLCHPPEQPRPWQKLSLEASAQAWGGLFPPVGPTPSLSTGFFAQVGPGTLSLHHPYSCSVGPGCPGHEQSPSHPFLAEARAAQVSELGTFQPFPSPVGLGLGSRELHHCSSSSATSSKYSPWQLQTCPSLLPEFEGWSEREGPLATPEALGAVMDQIWGLHPQAPAPNSEEKVSTASYSRKHNPSNGFQEFTKEWEVSELVGRWKSPPGGTKPVPWLSLVSASQSTQGAKGSSSGSARTTWDISELDADKELSSLVKVETQRVLSWSFAVTVVTVAITCFFSWNSMLMAPRFLSSNPLRARGLTLQRRKKMSSLVVERTCLYREERTGVGPGRCQFCLLLDQSLRSPETQIPNQ